MKKKLFAVKLLANFSNLTLLLCVPEGQWRKILPWERA